jgi:HAMP domain-containing protein
MVVNKAQEASVFNDLKIFVLLGAILIAFTALLFIAFVITRHLSPKTADKIKDQLKSLKQ